MLNNINTITLCGVFVALMGVLITLIFNIFQQLNNRRSSNIAVSISLLKEWRDQEFTLLRREMVSLLNDVANDPNKSFIDLDNNQILKLDKVSHLCDEIALRVIWKEADEDMIMTYIGLSLQRLWNAYKPYIEYTRANRGEEWALYQAGFEALAEKAKIRNPNKIESKNINKFLNENKYILDQKGNVAINQDHRYSNQLKED